MSLKCLIKLGGHGMEVHSSVSLSSGENKHNKLDKSPDLQQREDMIWDWDSIFCMPHTVYQQAMDNLPK